MDRVIKQKQTAKKMNPSNLAVSFIVVLDSQWMVLHSWNNSCNKPQILVSHQLVFSHFYVPDNPLPLSDFFVIWNSVLQEKQQVQRPDPELHVPGFLKSHENQVHSLHGTTSRLHLQI